MIPAGTPNLITGASPPATDQRIPLEFILPKDFWNGQVVGIASPLGPVNEDFKSYATGEVMTEPFWTLKLADCINFAILIATVAAIVYGPIKAVEITRRKDLERDAESRKRRIIATLMRTRKMAVRPDHVSALKSGSTRILQSPNGG